MEHSSQRAEVRFLSKVQKTPDCWLWTASTIDGYGQFQTAGKGSPMAKAHRYAYELWVGPIPPGMVVDHTCHERRCVRPDHLRAVTRGQNRQNRHGLASNNTSGYHGVSWAADRGKWRAQVIHDGEWYCAGVFDDPVEAGDAAKQLRNRLFTHNDHDRKDPSLTS